MGKMSPKAPSLPPPPPPIPEKESDAEVKAKKQEAGRIARGRRGLGSRFGLGPLLGGSRA